MYTLLYLHCLINTVQFSYLFFLTTNPFKVVGFNFNQLVVDELGVQIFTQANFALLALGVVLVRQLPELGEQSDAD